MIDLVVAEVWRYPAGSMLGERLRSVSVSTAGVLGAIGEGDRLAFT